MSGRARLLWALILLAQFAATGQERGTVTDSLLGVTFVIPSGWIGQKSGSGYLLGSEAHAGLILVIPHAYRTVEEMRTAALEGFQDEDGTLLTPTSDPEPLGSSGLRAQYSGMVEWQEARADAIGLISPYGGGVTLLQAVAGGEYSPAHSDAMDALARSVRFSKPKTGPIIQEWRTKLAGARLTFLSSYSSSSGDGSYGGYSDKEVIQLCAGGLFSYAGSSSVSVDAGAYGYGGESVSGRGQWRIAAPGGQPVLELVFEDGNLREYEITYPEEELHLNGVRYFLTYDVECP